jgi:hypothetical protein
MSTYTSEIGVTANNYHELSVEYTYTPPGAWMDYNVPPDPAEVELTGVTLLVGDLERVINPSEFKGLEEYIVEKLHEEHY